MNHTETGGLTRPAALRALLDSQQLEFLMEAHNAISARIAEEAGFRAIWGSGLALSAQCGVRDHNELSWSQVVDTLEFMTDATRVPILLDGDTGYGDFNNVRRLVRKLESRGIAGVCIEDKCFPKQNSFIAGEAQPLADMREFQNKIRAGKDSQQDPDFCIVARVEALIAGWGMEEALRRAEAYRTAGADAILIHSKRSSPEEILVFAREWGGRCPLVIVPTKYYSTPTEVFRKAGISIVIWANHLLRAAVTAMQETAGEIHETETLKNIEDRVAPLEEIFRLQGAEELMQAERRYSSFRGARARAVVLAAARGNGLDTLTQDRPKTMVPVAGQPLLRRMVDEFKRQGVNRILVVAGYRAQALSAVTGIELLHNPRHASSGELASLDCAAEHLGEDTVIAYGDLLFRSYILRDLLGSTAPLTIVVDSAPLSETPSLQRDLAYCSEPDDGALFHQDVDLLGIRSRPDPAMPVGLCGRWIGMLRAQGEGSEWLRQALLELREREDYTHLGMPELINHLCASGRPVKVLYIHGHWLDVNDAEDLRRAGDFAHGRLDRGERT